MRASKVLLLSLGSGALAYPASDASKYSPSNPDTWTAPIIAYLQVVGAKIATIRSTPSFPNPPPCNLEKCKMPEAAVALPPPSAGLKVAHVAIGRGTQNYTCADSLETTIPVATGAVATLYNGTCRAANYPEILAVTPGVELQFKPTDGESISPARLELSGHHYFTAAGVPAFDLNTPKPYGLLFGSKNASTPAPADALKGKGNQGFGAVPWLKLTHKEGSVGFQEVYRVNTAGGNPPPNCKGVKPGAFEVDYAAEYWLYN